MRKGCGIFRCTFCALKALESRLEITLSKFTLSIHAITGLLGFLPTAPPTA